MYRLVIILSVVFFTSTAFAAGLPSFFTGIRPLGMGGAFTAVANDENALFYNAAGLSYIEEQRFTVVNPLIDGSEKVYDMYRDVQDTDTDKAEEVTDLIREYIGKSYYGRAALYPNYIMKNFAFALMGQAQVSLTPRNVAYPEIEVDALISLSGHLGFAYSLLENQLRLGVAGKFISASHLSEIYTPDEIADSNFEDQVDDDLHDGTGLGVDLGLIYAPPVASAPTVALTVLDVGDTSLGDAGSFKQKVNVGFSLSQELSWFTLTEAADWVDILNNTGDDEDVYKRLHFGLEAGFTDYLSARAGFNQGYATFGVTLDLKILKLDYATYGEEVGSYAGSRENRRHVVQLSMVW